MPIKHTFTPRELISSTHRKIMNSVAESYLKLGDYTRDGVILEDLGSWLEQQAWTDVTGYYMTLRLAPLDLGRVSVQEAGQKMLSAFTDLFPGKKFRMEEETGSFVSGGKMTVYVTTDTYGIAD
jgi:hypothetical protein